MKKYLPVLLILVSYFLSAQVTTSPATPTVKDEIIITLNTIDTGLSGYTGDVYAHTGVLTSNSSNNGDWKYVIGSWGDNTQQPKLTKIDDTTYELKITPDVFGFYNISTSIEVTHLALVFRSADGSKQTSPDIFIELYQEGLNVALTSPSSQNLVYDLNETIPLSADASIAADLELFVDEVSQKKETGKTISTSYTLSQGGKSTVKVTATNGSETAQDELNIYVKTPTENAPIPANVKDGVNISNDKVTLVLTAPNKQSVFVIGDFNHWSLEQDYQMKRDGDKFWITLDNLDTDKEYAYQYYVDYELKVADPLSTKILDPFNDQYIPKETYANIKAYPSGLTEGNVSVFKINQDNYSWQVNNFKVADPDNLVVYELLLRDFEVVNTDDIGDLKKALTRLDYLENLGVNAIELMPVNEFEGNDSWGYNPSFHGGLDKAYGTSDDLKMFVDACHQRGIAVFLDVVYNHAFGQSPLVQLYWDKANNRPSSDNPWLNPIAKHDYNVGYDFNHESEYTKTYVKQTLQYWIEEYKIDGFRYDLSKGFTQKNTLGDTNAWGQYDASRIAILKDYADFVWSLNPDVVQILEHFAVNTEEKELSAYGFLLWGNSNHNYNQSTMGYMQDADISWISYQERGWSQPHVMGYMESHDEERLMYKNLQYGNESGSYSIKNLETALKRESLAANFLFTIPGPKMIWQFGELGYDVNIDYNGRTGRKPVRWDYFNDPNRKSVYDTWATLIAFKKKEPAFQTSDYDLEVDGLVKKIVLKHNDMDVVILGNFDVINQTANTTFTKTGTWYEYYTDASLSVTNTNMDISLAPGEYRLYSTKLLKDPLSVESDLTDHSGLKLYPNPASSGFQINKPADKIEIFDYLGRKVRVFKGQFNSNQKYNTFGLTPAIYLVKIEHNNNYNIVKLLVQ